MRSFSLLLILCLLSTVMQANSADINGDQPNFFETTAKKGDGVYSLLRKFQLETNGCNRSKFYELNNLKTDASLLIGKNYKLPIFIYNYNNTSIRSTIGIDDWDKATMIKDYNEKLEALKIKKESYLTSKELWVPYNYIDCLETTTKLPTQSAQIEKREEDSYLIEPLFGTRNSKVVIKDQSLKNKVYYLVSGHGGIDPGASCDTCPQTMCEDEYAYDVALRLAKNLMERGATVHVIIQDKNDGIRSEQYLKCDTDEKCLGQFALPGNQLRRLEQRTKTINRLYVKYKNKGIKEQYAVMIHIDSRTKDKRVDTFFYYFEKSKTSKSLANHMQKTFKDKYDYYQKGRGYKGFVATRNLYMVRHTYPAALYVELGNIKNSGDQKRFLLPENRQALANWLFEGFMNFED